MKTQLIAHTLYRRASGEKEKKTERERGRGKGREREKGNERMGRSQLALRFGQRTNERNKARVIKITVAVI